jgi:hypothetical protein
MFIKLEEFNMKKIVACLVTAIAVIFMGCTILSGPETEPSTGSGAEQYGGDASGPIAEGTGRIVLSIVEEGAGISGPSLTMQARSVMPSPPTFSKYKLEFHTSATWAAGNAAVTVDNIVPSSLAGGFSRDLAAGTWYIKATGYITENSVDYPAATNAAAVSVTLTAGNQTNATVTISPYAITGSGNGVFTWNISISSTLASGSMTLRKKGAGSDALTKTLTDSAERIGSAELEPGYYDMSIVLTKDGKQAGVFEEVHIYPGLKTELPFYSFNDGDFSTAVNIAGRVSVRKPAGLAISNYTLTARTGSQNGTIIAQTAVTFAAGTTATTSPEWIITVPSASLATENQTLYWTLAATDSNGYLYQIQNNTSVTIPPEGVTIGSAVCTLALYGVTLPASDTSGTVSTARPAYQSEETVTLTAMPGQNYIFSGKPQVSGVSAGNVIQSGNNFIFIMPTSDQTVTLGTSTNKFLCTDATLSGLTMTNVTGLSFSPTTSNYIVNTSAASTTSTIVTPAKSTPYQKITITGTDYTSSPSKSVTLNTGVNTVTVVVTPQSGSAVTYTITVNKPPRPALGDAYAYSGV